VYRPYVEYVWDTTGDPTWVDPSPKSHNKLVTFPTVVLVKTVVSPSKSGLVD
jgi:hypothetical protein